MDAVLQVVEESQKLDLLDRQEFVNRMLTIANVLSDNKKNACYAVNGDWGVGKSFVLDMFERQAQREHVEGEELPRYLIFRYNCWEYDYYEEPLVAIVASILDQIDKKENLLSADLKERIVALLKVIGKGLLKKAVHLIDDKTGVDLEKAVEVIKEGGEAAEEAIKESHEYDQYYSFKKTLRLLQKTISSISETKSVIFIVDELDRCLPKYTIKVLERLHHLFEGINNVQVILSIDCGQLEHIVQQIYGKNTDAKSYLRKFIQFELKLDKGTIKNHFDERFKAYTQHFKNRYRSTSAVEVEEFKAYILEGMDMRKRISIINQCELIHGLMKNNEIVDTCYLCLELFLVILNDYGVGNSDRKKTFHISHVFEKLPYGEDSRKDLPKGLQFMADRIQPNHVPKNSSQLLYDSRTVAGKITQYVNVSCLVGKLLFAYRTILGFEDMPFGEIPGEQIADFKEYTKEFWQYLQILH